MCSASSGGLDIMYAKPRRRARLQTGHKGRVHPRHLHSAARSKATALTAVARAGEAEAGWSSVLYASSSDQ